MLLPLGFFLAEVDRITKEADHVESSDEEVPQPATAPIQAKRGRFSQSQDNGSQRRTNRQVSTKLKQNHLNYDIIF